MLIFNATLLQPHHPSWWTGKLSDTATAAALALVFLKTLASLNQTVNQWLLSTLSTPMKLALDPTDLCVLPAGLLTIWIWEHPFIYYTAGRKAIQIGAVFLTAAALLADAPAPVDNGITCLIQSGNSTIAIRERISRGYGGSKPYQTAYISHDGGETWQYDGNVASAATPTPDPQAPSSIPITTDLVTQYCPSQPDTWTFLDPSEAGILIQNPDFGWKLVPLGEIENIDTSNKI